MKAPVLLAALLLASCASAPPAPVGLVAAERLAQAVAPGQSTRDQVRGALGPATVIRFDSGYEVWLYRYAPSAGTVRSHAGSEPDYAEFVILFGPDGIARKVRRREPGA